MHVDHGFQREDPQMKIAAAGAIALVISSHAAAADSDLTGKYSGGYDVAVPSGTVRANVILNILSVSDGSVKAVLERITASRTARQPPCDGQYPLEGTLKDNSLDLRATEKGGRAGDCGMRVRGTLQGTKLIGKVNQADVELSK
jgi:hypothetical protein